MTEPSDKDHLRTDIGFVLGIATVRYELTPGHAADVFDGLAGRIEENGLDGLMAGVDHPESDERDMHKLRNDTVFALGAAWSKYGLGASDCAEVLREAAGTLEEGGYEIFFGGVAEPDGGAERVQDQPWGAPDDD